jgi:hypothetical protein
MRLKKKALSPKPNANNPSYGSDILIIKRKTTKLLSTPMVRLQTEEAWRI